MILFSEKATQTFLALFEKAIVSFECDFTSYV